MAHRMFSDATGREWLVWDVVPQASDRREVADRRIGVAGGDRRQGDGRPDDEVLSDDEFDRRVGISRRALTSRRHEAEDGEPPHGRTFAHLPRAFSSGWLCFESGSERRRLGPTPLGWYAMSEGALRELLEQATRVSASRATLDTAKMRAMVRPPGEQRA